MYSFTFKILLYWVLFVIVITIFSGVVYLVIQQEIRQSANDPQIQLAEDTANALTNGVFPQSFIPQTRVAINKSLATFVIIFDNNGKPVVSSAQLDGQIPILPSGVFDWVNKNGEDRFTWQPNDRVRSATVITKYTTASSSGFVLVGRSLREVEKRENNLMREMFVGWIMTLIATFVSLFIFVTLQKKKKI